MDKLSQLVSSTVKGMGYAYVLSNFSSENKTILQVLIENKDGSGVTVADCQKISRNLSAVLDVEDIISSEYTLEVSSTGMDRPLTIIEDYDRFKGFLVKLETYELVGTRKKFRGIVLGRKENTISIEMPEGKSEIDFENIRKSKLVVTDEMIRNALKKKD